MKAQWHKTTYIFSLSPSVFFWVMSKKIKLRHTFPFGSGCEKCFVRRAARRERENNGPRPFACEKMSLMCPQHE